MNTLLFTIFTYTFNEYKIYCDIFYLILDIDVFGLFCEIFFSFSAGLFIVLIFTTYILFYWFPLLFS